MIFKSRKNKVINSYLVALPKMMTKGYGKSSEYTALQVIKSIDRYKFNTKYQAFAVTLHCSEEEFFSYFNNEFSKSEYQELRDEISKKYFNGFDFKSRDVSKYSVMFSNYKYVDSNEEGDIGIPDGDGD